LGQHEEAVSSFTLALEQDPGFTDALYHKGLSLAELGRFPDAIEALGKTLETSPKIANAWLIKGFCLFAEERYQEAILSYDNALEIEASSLPSGKRFTTKELPYPTRIIFLKRLLHLNRQIA
jgi:tetratricopeptide (TPR) repeat protein